MKYSFPTLVQQLLSLIIILYIFDSTSFKLNLYPITMIFTHSVITVFKITGLYSNALKIYM